MGVNGHQDLWITGSRVYFQRDPIATVKQPIFDLGRITNAAPAVAKQEATLYDNDGGVQRAIAVQTVRLDESYEFRSSNMSMDNLALLFSASATESFTQVATARTDVTHWAIPGRLMKILDATGQPVYGVASIEAITGVPSSPTYVAGTDYEVVSLERGIIRWLSTGSLTVAANVNVDYTPRAITGPNRRLLRPMTEGCTATGTALFFWGRCFNNQQTVREVRVQLAASGGTFPEDNFADFGLKMTVLSDPTKTIPAGRLLYWLGDEPAMA